MKEVWLLTQTVLRASNGKKYIRNKEDYLVNTKEDGVTTKEIKGWILDTHYCFASSSFYANEPIPVKKTRPRKDVTRYTTEVRHGTLETSIVRMEKVIQEPQATLF